MEQLLLEIPSNDFFDEDFITKVSQRLPLIHKTEGKGTKKTERRYVGDEVIIESPHPYRDNTDEYQVVEVDRAISYEITFDNRSMTESGYDYVTFYKDDSHSEFWGDNKYTGGRGGSSRNFPGIDGRPPLIISAGRFKFFFHSDGGGNDWGYRIQVVPILVGPPQNPPVPVIDVNDLADIFLSSDFDETTSADIYSSVRELIKAEESDVAHDPSWLKRKNILSHLNLSIAKLIQEPSKDTSAKTKGAGLGFDWAISDDSFTESSSDVIIAASIGASVAAITGLEGPRQRVALDKLSSTLTRIFAATLPSLAPLSLK